MQMTGTQRIAASRDNVWASLFDPEVLEQCIPGCQSLSKESAERMRAVAEIKIGPIGARFNATVTMSEVETPRAYTLTIEAQGGTVGFVKSRIKVQLADDGGATVLSYDVDAEVGGRLAQLGGALIDATAKQLATKFFVKFGALAQGSGAAPASGATLARGPSATAVQAMHQPPRRDLPIAWLLALGVAALCGYLVGHAQRGGESDWMGLAIGLLVMIVAGAGFEFGRRSAAPVVMLDATLLARLSEESKR